MNEKEFREDYIDRVVAVLKFAYTNEHSDFYKKRLYGHVLGANMINDYDSFSKLPILRKQDLVMTRLEDRLFVSDRDIGFIYFTGGTTTKPLVLAGLKSKKSSAVGVRYREEEMLKLGVKKFLMLMPVTSGVFMNILAQNKKVIMIPGDIGNLKNTAIIAEQAGYEAIITTPTILERYYTEMDVLGYKTKNIKYISIGSEYFSDSKIELLKKKFPGALFRMGYGTSESGGIAYPCPMKELSNYHKYHLADNCLIETINKDSEGFGDILITSLTTDRAFPLIRYQIGDVGRVINETCPYCGHSKIFEIKGRSPDFGCKISGCEINLQLAEKIINKYPISDFQIRVSEEYVKVEDRVMAKIILLVVLEENKNIIKETFIEDFNSSLQVGAKSYLSDLISKKVFLDTEVTIVEKIEQTGAKSVKLLQIS